MLSFATFKKRSIAPLLALLFTQVFAAPALANVLYPADKLMADQARFDATSHKLAIDDLLLPSPLLLTFSRHSALDEIHVGYERRGKSLASSFARLADGTRFIWIDACSILTAFLDAETNSAGEICAIYGLRGHVVSQFDLTASGGTFRFQELFEGAKPAGDPEQDQKVYFQQVLQGDIPVVATTAQDTIPTDFPGLTITSAGFGRGESRVRTLTHASLETGIDLTLDAGLNLVGIHGDGTAHLIDNLFNCDPDFDVSQHQPWNEMLKETSVPYAFYGVIAHDTGFCGAGVEDLKAIYDNLPLPSIQNIDFRKPYIGLFKDDQSLGEFSNSVSNRTQIYVSGTIDIAGDLSAATETPAISTIKATARAPIAPGIPVVTAPTVTTAPVQAREFHALSDIAPQDLAAGCSFASSKGSAERAPLSRDWSFGQALAPLFKASSGFWNIEAEGAWFGAPRGDLRFDLKTESTGPLALRVQGATYQGRAHKIWSAYDADGTYIGQTVQGEFVVDLPLLHGTTSNAGQLPILIRTDDYSCPKADGFGEDTRALSIYIKGMQIVDASSDQPVVLPVAPQVERQETQPAAPSVSHQIPANTSPEATCDAYENAPPIAPRISPLWIGENLRLSEALDDGLLALGDGWWPQTRGGYRLGSVNAAMHLRLPDIQEPLSLILTTRDATTFGLNGLRWNTTTIAPILINDRTAVQFDVSSLPRGQMLTLELLTDQMHMTCATTRDGLQFQSGPMISSVWLRQASADVSTE